MAIRSIATAVIIMVILPTENRKELHDTSAKQGFTNKFKNLT